MTKNVTFNIIASLVSILTHFVVIVAFEQLGYAEAFLIYTTYITVLFLTGFFDFGNLIHHANRLSKLKKSRLNSVKMTRIIVGMLFYYGLAAILLAFAIYFKILLSAVNLSAILIVLIVMAIVTKGITNIPITLLRVQKQEFKASQNLIFTNVLRLVFFAILFLGFINEEELSYYMLIWVIFVNICELSLHLLRLKLSMEFRPSKFSKRFIVSSFHYFKISASSSYLKGFDKILAGNSLNNSLSEFNASIMFYGLCNALNGAIAGNFLSYFNRLSERKAKIAITIRLLFFISIIYLGGVLSWYFLSDPILGYAFLSLDVVTIKNVVTLYICGGWIAAMQQVLYMVRVSVNILENYVFILVSLGIIATVFALMVEVDIFILPLIFASIFTILLLEHIRTIYLHWDKI